MLINAFTTEGVDASGRAKILHMFYMMMRMVAWADGIDNGLVSGCLDETFNSWMALFLQII